MVDFYGKCKVNKPYVDSMGPELLATFHIGWRHPLASDDFYVILDAKQTNQFKNVGLFVNLCWICKLFPPKQGIP